MRKLLLLSLCLLLTIPAFPEDKKEEEPNKKEEKKKEKVLNVHTGFGADMISGGNSSDLEKINFELKVQWIPNAKRDLEVDLQYLYSESDDDVIQDYGRANLKYRSRFSEKFFSFLQAKAERDEVAGLDLRAAAAGGLGYYIIKTERLELSIDGGPSYIYESGDGLTYEDEGNLGYVFSQQFKYLFNNELLEDLELKEIISVESTAQGFDEYIITGRIELKKPLTKYLAASIYAQIKHDSILEEASKTDDNIEANEIRAGVMINVTFNDILKGIKNLKK